jgi:hypothetical protein
VKVYNGPEPDGTASVVSVHATFHPTFGIKAGDPVIFLSRGRETGAGNDIFDFGDGTPKVEVPSNISADYHVPNGYGMVSHHYKKPGNYIVRVERKDDKTGYTGVQHLHVIVEP